MQPWWLPAGWAGSLLLISGVMCGTRADTRGRHGPELHNCPAVPRSSRALPGCGWLLLREAIAAVQQGKRGTPNELAGEAVAQGVGRWEKWAAELVRDPG